jgi:hypothetical protein
MSDLGVRWQAQRDTALDLLLFTGRLDEIQKEAK